jgi:Tol biopolymer transport system component/DNA-binding winged helix-turn-helix (wHTH) protein
MSQTGDAMGDDRRPPQIVRFGVFEADLESAELRKNGLRVPLQGQPFQVFTILLQHAGKLVTREELRQKVWPEDTFVDFDHGLNTAITKIRTALGDSAENPRFVETMPRRGYRFIGPVAETSSQEPLASTPKERFVKLTARWRLVGVVVAFLILVSGIGIWRFARGSLDPPPALEVLPLVAMQGEDTTPAFSPDGNQVAFSHSGPNASGIYTTLVDSEKPLRLTDDPRDSHPTWSPDGRQVAFVRRDAEEFSIHLVPALGGTEHKLRTTRNAFLMNGYLNWSPDGKVVAFSEGRTDSFSFGIALLSLDDLTARPLTSPPIDKADWGPAFSPDGTTVAFVRAYAPGWSLGDLFVIPAKGGEPRQLTFENCELSGLSWTEDGNDIVFSSNRGGVQSLWRISASGGAPRPVQGVGGPAYDPSISRKGDRLVYTQSSYSDNIWRLDLKSEKTAQGPPVRVTSTSRGFNRRPNLSPDGKKIVLESDRLGYSDIWYCDSDGSNCEQLTSLHGTAGTARLSPDGHYVVFEFRRQEHEEIHVVEVPGGRPRLVPTFPGADNGAPNWSRDGQWIYFYSDHEGRPFQLWKVPFKGGPPVRVTTNGGVYAVESDDGRFLYYSKYTQPGVWRMPVAGGEEVRILDQPAGRQWFSWALTPNGIYFLAGAPPDGKLEFFDFATGKTISIFVLEKPVPLFSGLALSSDGKSLLFGQLESSDSYIMWAKNFR